MDIVSKDDYDECYHRLDVALDVIEVLEEARKSAGLSFQHSKQAIIKYFKE